MRVLHLYKDYCPVIGGIENHTRQLARAQAARGHDVTVLACATGIRTQTFVEDGVQVVKTGRLATVASMPLSVRLPFALRRHTPEIVHIHSPFPLGEFANWLWRRGTATVITYHSDVVRQRKLLVLYGPILRRVLRTADAIIATSPRYVETSPWLQRVKDRCTVVPLGVDLDAFKPRNGDATDKPHRLLFVGKLRYYKGLDTLLHALPQIPGAQLEVVGDGPMKTRWEALANQHGLMGTVRFVGEVSDEELIKSYASADVFVLPANARAEAFGTVLLEAMAAGLPVVSTELGTGTSWVNQDNVTGRVVPARDPDAMADAIRVMLKDPAGLRRMGAAARDRAVKHFSLQQMVDGVDEVYRSVLKGQHAKPVGAPAPSRSQD